MSDGIKDEAPAAPVLTEYDRRNAPIYLRLLDAEREGADWRQAAQALLDVRPDDDPTAARRRYESHLARARWMTSEGYRAMLQTGRR